MVYDPASDTADLLKPIPSQPVDLRRDQPENLPLDFVEDDGVRHPRPVTSERIMIVQGGSMASNWARRGPLMNDDMAGTSASGNTRFPINSCLTGLVPVLRQSLTRLLMQSLSENFRTDHTQPPRRTVGKAHEGNAHRAGEGGRRRLENIPCSGEMLTPSSLLGTDGRRG